MNVIDKGNKLFMNTYSRFPIVLEHGEGVYIYDSDNNKYLDFVAGIAVNSLGYQDQTLNKALIEQIEKLTHCSNLYYNTPAVEAANLLVQTSDLERVFFCNSGAEAVEGAIKLARKYAQIHKSNTCYKIISMKQSFHGRTLGALAATGQTKYQQGYNPLLPGIEYAEYNNFEELQSLIDETVCAILIEPVQGEGGIRPAEKEYLEKVRKLCDEQNIILIFDEVQCGIGRTGEIFAYQNYNVLPDIVTLAKGLGAGIPIGAMIAKEKIANAFEPGSHASTFGGNPLATTAAKIVMGKVGKPDFLENIREVGDYLTNKLNELLSEFEFIIDRRGIGLMQGIELNIPVKKIIQKTMEKGLLLINAGTHVIRFVPPLIVNKEHIDEMITILSSVLEEAAYEES